jgi:hypothetical protein
VKKAKPGMRMFEATIVYGVYPYTHTWEDTIASEKSYLRQQAGDFVSKLVVKRRKDLEVKK